MSRENPFSFMTAPPVEQRDENGHPIRAAVQTLNAADDFAQALRAHGAERAANTNQAAAGAADNAAGAAAETTNTSPAAKP